MAFVKNFFRSNGAWISLLLSCGVALSLSSVGAGCGDGGSAGSGSGTAGSGGEGGSGASAMGGSGGVAGMGGSGGAAGMGGSGGSMQQCEPGTAGALPALKLTEVANGLARPVFAGGAPGDTTRLFIIEKSGRIRVLSNGMLLPDPFLDITSVVNVSGNERGLLGLAFHPGYAQNGRFFVYYTRKPDGAIVVAEYKQVAGSPDKADPAPVKEFFAIDHSQASNHNGGMIAFGKDGLLYIGTGDGGGAGDPQGNGQKLDTRLAKILRINVDTYPMPPPGNLQNGDPDIWDWGMRNPWRFSFDRCTGDLYIADVGQDKFEEIDIEAPGDGLKNYGWNTMEASACFNPAQGCNKAGLTLPVAEYPHAAGKCSVSGGYVYRGTKIPGLVGTYFYGDYCTKQVFTLAWSKGNLITTAEVTQDLDSTSLSSGITSFGEDTSGELYVVIDNSQAGELGKVYRIDPK